MSDSIRIHLDDSMLYSYKNSTVEFMLMKSYMKSYHEFIYALIA